MKICFFLFLCTIAVAATAQDSVQAQLMGKYKFPDGSVVAEVNVVFENGNLIMNSTAGASVLELIKGDSFNLVTFNGTAVFKRNDAKKVIAVHIDASGYVLDGVKDAASLKNNLIKIQPPVPAGQTGPLQRNQAEEIARPGFPAYRKSNVIISFC